MKDLLGALAPLTPWILSGMAALATLTLGYIGWVLLGRTVPENDDPGEAVTGPGPTERRLPPSPAINPVTLRLTMRTAYRALRAYAPRATRERRDPWILALGPAGAEKREILHGTGLPIALPELTEGPIGWYVFDQGVVIDVPEALIQDARGGDDPRGWETFLQTLVRYRPERPVDALLLVIPVHALAADRPPGPAEHQLGEILFEKLRQAQQVLGLRLPVHVLISGLEDIPGFPAFAGALEPGQREDALGWANPYPLDTAYREDWLPEAMATIHDRLVRASMDVLAGRGNLADAEGIFRFPDRILALGEPLTALLATLFRESAYHEGFFLRGIYFTGKQREGADGGAERSGPLFLSRLFQRKIFPERGLALPFRSSLLDRNRKVRRLQIAAVVLLILGPLGITIGHFRLSSNTRTLEESLTRLERSLALMDQAMATPGLSISAIGADDSLFVALSQMADLNHRNFRALWLPTSWLHTIDPLIDRTLALGFQEAVLPIMRRSLLEWADTLTYYEWAATLGNPGEGGAGTIPWSGVTVPEDGAMLWYLREADSLDLNVRRFNTVIESGDLAVFAELVGWYFEQPLPVAFRAKGEFFQQALVEARMSPIRPSERMSFPEDLLRVSGALAEVTYDDLLVRIEALDGALSAITLGSPGSAGVADLDRLLQDLDRLERFLDRSESWWLDLRLPLDPQFDEILNRMPEEGIFSGPQFAAPYRRTLERIRTERLTQLERLPSFARVLGPSPLAVTGEEGGLELSPVLAELSAGVRDLLSQGFMRPVHEGDPPGSPVFGGRPRWDLTPLQRLLGIVSEAQSFQQDRVDRFPVALQAAVREVVARALDLRVQEAVGASMTWVPGGMPVGRRALDDELGQRLASFDAAAQRLVRIMELDQQAGGFELTDVLAQIILMEMGDLLEQADQLLDALQPYQASLLRWMPSQPANWAAFGVSDAEALERYLEQQRGGVQQLADRHVRRILGYANLPPVDAQLRLGTDAFSASVQARITRWERILRSLDQYEAQEPGTPLIEFERFIRQDMAATGPGGCPPRGGAPPASTADWFGALHDRIARAYQQRCGELAAAQVSAGYEELRAFFNASLAGRFPFAPQSQARLAPDADPFSVREFLRRQEALLRPLGDDGFAAIRSLPGGEDVVSFLSSMQRLTPLLTPLLATEEEPAPGIGFRVDFRTSRALERGADQIAEWTLQVGEQRMSLGQDEGQRQGVWRPGQSVELSLRWASGSPRRPVIDADGARVDGARVSFRHEGPWALLRLMAVHAPTPDALLAASLGGGQPEPGSLLLVIPTAARDTTPPRTGVAEGAGLAVAFVRLRLREPTTGTLTPPGVFPVIAPALMARSPVWEPR